MAEDHGDISAVAQKFLVKYPEVVHVAGTPYVGCKTVEHRILYKGPVFYCKQYRTPHVMEQQVLAEVDRLIQEDLIEATDSAYNNAYLPVVKIDEKTKKTKLRLVLDLRRLNRSIEVDRLQVGDVQDLLNQLHGARYLTVIDASQGYLRTTNFQALSKKISWMDFKAHV